MNLTEQLIRRGDHRSVDALEADIRAWVKNWNADPKPFVWTKTAQDILESLGRLIYLPTDGFETLNIVSTIGSFILGASMIVFTWNVFRSWRYGAPVTVDDPWGYANSLEWATSCPPPRHNFYEATPNPLRTTRLRTALPAHDRTHARRIPHRRPSRKASGDRRRPDVLADGT